MALNLFDVEYTTLSPLTQYLLLTASAVSRRDPAPGGLTLTTRPPGVGGGVRGCTQLHLYMRYIIGACVCLFNVRGRSGNTLDAWLWRGGGGRAERETTHIYTHGGGGGVCGVGRSGQRGVAWEDVRFSGGGDSRGCGDCIKTWTLAHGLRHSSTSTRAARWITDSRRHRGSLLLEPCPRQHRTRVLRMLCVSTPSSSRVHAGSSHADRSPCTGRIAVARSDRCRSASGEGPRC